MISIFKRIYFLRRNARRFKWMIFYSGLLYFIFDGIFYLPHILISKNNIIKITEIMKSSKKTIFICSHNHIPIDYFILFLIAVKNIKYNTNIITVDTSAMYLYNWCKFVYKIPIKLMMPQKKTKKDYIKMNKRIVDENENLIIFLEKHQKKAKGVYKTFTQTDADIVMIKFKIKMKIKPIEYTVEKVNTKNLKTKNLEDFNKIILNQLYN